MYSNKFIFHFFQFELVNELRFNIQNQLPVYNILNMVIDLTTQQYTE